MFYDSRLMIVFSLLLWPGIFEMGLRPVDWAIRTLVSFSVCEPQQRSGAKQTDSERETYVNVTLRLRTGEKPEIVRTTQVEGKLIVREAPSSKFVYEVVKDNTSYAVGFLPQGGFELRGFSDRTSSREEKKSETSSTTVTLAIPNMRLETLRNGQVGFRIYEIRSGVELEPISKDALKRLVSNKSAFIRSEITGSAVANGMREKSR